MFKYFLNSLLRGDDAKMLAKLYDMIFIKFFRFRHANHKFIFIVYMISSRMQLFELAIYRFFEIRGKTRTRLFPTDVEIEWSLAFVDLFSMSHADNKNN